MNLIQQIAALPAYLGLAPRNARGVPDVKGVSLRLEFTALYELEFDLVHEAQQNIMSIVQAVWIENWQNNGVFRLRVGGFSQEIVCPAFSNGMFPIIASGPGKFVAQHSMENAVVPIILLNVPQPYFVHPVV